MPSLILRRLSQVGRAIYGHLVDDRYRLIAVTLESADPDDRVPPGTYPLRRRRLHRRRAAFTVTEDVFEVQRVPNHMHGVALEVGNFRDDAECGDILVGTDFTKYEGFGEEVGIRGSERAFKNLMHELADAGDDATLTIVDPPDARGAP